MAQTSLRRCEEIAFGRRVVGAIRQLADGCPRAATRAAPTTLFFHTFFCGMRTYPTTRKPSSPRRSASVVTNLREKLTICNWQFRIQRCSSTCPSTQSPVPSACYLTPGTCSSASSGISMSQTRRGRAAPPGVPSVFDSLEVKVLHPT